MSEWTDERNQVEANLTALYGPDDSEEKIAHRSRVINEDGNVNGFQASALRGMVIRAEGERASEGQDELDKRPAPLPPVPEELAGDIPEPIEGYENRIDLVQEIKGRTAMSNAYLRWGKPQVPVKSIKKDGNHIRCPFPTHEDNNPSAWFDSEKDTWFCGGCQEGGDVIDFWMIRKHGQIIRDKDGFRAALVEMAEELGIPTEPPAEPPPAVPVPEPEPDPEPSTDFVAPEPDVPPAPDNEAPATPIEPEIAALDEDLDYDERDSLDPFEDQRAPTYEWEDLKLPRGTFLDEWMRGNTADFPWIPPEYFMMLGFQALGLACGHHVQTTVGSHGRTNVSMMLCLIGPSALGKSTALEREVDLFFSATGSTWNPDLGSGVRVITTPGSPEALLRDLYHDIEDPSDPTRRDEVPITGFLKEDELATFLSKAGRKGGEHLKQRVMGLHDFRKKRHDRELVFADSSLSNGQRALHDTFFSATWLSQTAVIRRQVEDSDMFSGFMNRIIPVFGQRRHVPLMTDPPPSEDPTYVPAWRNTWDRIRDKPLLTVIPIARSAAAWVDAHPYWAKLTLYEKQEELSILARLKHTTHRIALLLAVNEDASAVEIRHYEVALDLAERYIQKCYGTLYTSAKASETKDLRGLFLKFLRDYKLRHNEWPTKRDIAKQYWWTHASEANRYIVETSLIADQQIAIIGSIRAGQQKVTKKVYIATDQDDYWGAFAEHHGKNHNEDALKNH